MSESLLLVIVLFAFYLLVSLIFKQEKEVILSILMCFFICLSIQAIVEFPDDTFFILALLTITIVNTIIVITSEKTKMRHK